MGVVAAIHRRRVLPLAERRLRLAEMKPGVDLEGTRMSLTSLSADDLLKRIAGTIGRQLELGQAIGERDQSWSQATEAVSRAEALRGQLVEATERLAEASARAGTLAESLAEAVESAQSAQAEASQQRARAEGVFCPLCDFVFVSILHLVSEEFCPAVCRVRDGS
jgi:DNA repair exonuclease SbcCD ATPase subunit